MKAKWESPSWWCTLVLGAWGSLAHAQNVTITPLGSVRGEFCVGDRALLFEDPTGVRILTAPGRTVNGSRDPRLPNPADPAGGVHVYVIRNGTVRALPEGGNAPPVLFGPGETIGEAPFIDGEPISGTVTALERVDLLVIRSGKLADALAGHPEAGYALYRAIARSLAGRLRRAVAMLAFAREREARS